MLLYADAPQGAISRLLSRYGLHLQWVQAEQAIPSSYWGDCEAGLIGSTLYLRSDTPVHSLLHEACHYICMDGKRRAALNTNAGGHHLEECAVCYLQIILADLLPNIGAERIMADMDAWGYSFRLGSCKRWFQDDADDAHQFLQQHNIIDSQQQPTWRLRI